MAKAILELPEMPENCKECSLHSWRSNGYASTLICKILLVNGLPHKRREDCPLKPIDALREKAEREKGGRAMRIDLLERWLKAYPYGYCDGMNFQTCRANENTECPYCASNVHCSDGNAAIDYYREMLRYMRLKPWQARKRTLMFAETLPSIMRSLDKQLNKEREE